MRLKGVFFSMDAALALLVTMVVLAGVISVIAVVDQPQDNSLIMSRLARDVYEIKNANPSINVNWIRTSCAGENNIAVESALVYDSSSNSVVRYGVTVC